RGNHVLFFHRRLVFLSPHVARMQEFPRKLPSEFLPRGGLRWLLAEVTFAEKPADDILQGPTGGGDLAVTIAGLPKKLLGERIDHHVCGAGVESDNLIEGCSHRKRGDVCDTSNIEHPPANRRIAIEQVIKEG